MVNQYRKYFANQPNVPFNGNVYPADLVTKTALLEKEVARQKQALEEKERLIKELTDANAQCNATSDDEEEVDDEQDQQTLAESERTMAELADKQARINELEIALEDNRKLLSDRTRAQSIHPSLPCPPRMHYQTSGSMSLSSCRPFPA
jgi:ATPase subunit of ABC transporter with duplicated ATPase domains